MKRDLKNQENSRRNQGTLHKLGWNHTFGGCGLFRNAIKLFSDYPVDGCIQESEDG